MPAGWSSVLGGAFDLALAKAVPTIPDEPGLQFEPKWDGVRAAIAVASGRARICSRNRADLTASFPELEQAALAQIPDSTVVDGEIVSWGDGRLDFDAVVRRMGAGQVLARRLAASQPASFVAFDVLAVLGRDVRPLRLSDRRALLEELAAGFAPPMQISPATLDRGLALQWWDDLAETGVEGLVAKRDQPYKGGERSSWLKIKHYEPQDAVAAAVIGSRSRPSQLVLGVHDFAGRLGFAGRTGPLSSAQAAKAAPFLHAPAGEHPWPEEVPSTWLDRFAKERHLVHLTLVEPVVVEVSADTARTGLAFRHSTRLIRFRPDLDPMDVRTI